MEVSPRQIPVSCPTEPPVPNRDMITKSPVKNGFKVRAGYVSVRACPVSVRAGHVSVRAGHVGVRAGPVSVRAGPVSSKEDRIGPEGDYFNITTRKSRG
jgi:hypothetical protein